MTHYHHQRMGWSVIVYDRFGMHKEFLLELMHLPGVFYHPYTLYQLALPSKYNQEFAQKQGVGYKVHRYIDTPHSMHLLTYRILHPFIPQYQPSLPIHLTKPPP